MEIFNGRYMVLKKLTQDKLFSRFLVKDKEAPATCQKVLVLPHTKIWNKNLLNETIENFIFWTSLDQENMTRLYRFDVLREVNGHKIELPRYFYTREHVASPILLEKLIPSIKREQVWDIFEQICRGVYFLNLRGEKIPYLNPSSIFSVKGEGIKFKLEDLLTLKIKNNAGLNSRTGPETGNIVGLGLILLSLLTNRITGQENWRQVLNQLEEQGRKEKQLAEVIYKMITGDLKDNYRGIYTSIKLLEKLIPREFRIIEKDKLERFNSKPRLIGRKRELEVLLKHCENIPRNKKKLLLLRGEFGIGKTRLLQEIAYRLRFSSVKPYYFEPAVSEFFSPWPELVKESLKNRKHFMEEEVTLPASFSEDSGEQKDFNKMYNHLRELAQSQYFAVLIDKLEKCNDEALEFMDFLLERGLLFFPVIATTNLRSSTWPVAQYLGRWQERGLVLNIDLNRLDWQDTTALIKELLSLPNLPANFARVVLEETGGNPTLIKESLKYLKADGQLFIGDNGNWEVTHSDFSQLHFPGNLVEALREQYSSLSTKEKEILQLIAVFDKAAPLNLMEKILEEKQELRTGLSALQEKDMVVMMISDEGYSFDFNQQQLKRLIYREIPPELRSGLHQKVLHYLEKQFHQGQYWVIDEIAYHLEVLGYREKAARYYYEAARKVIEEKKFNRAIIYYQQALKMAGDDELRLNLLLGLGNTWFELGQNHRAVKVYKHAISLAVNLDDTRQHAHILNRLSETYYRINELEEAMGCARKAVDLSLEEWSEHWEGYYQQLKVLYRRRNIEQGIELAKKLLNSLDPDAEPIFRGRVYNFLGLFHHLQGQLNEALDFYHTSIDLFNRAGADEEMLKPNNNIGVLYSVFLGNREQAYKYYRRNAEIAEKLNLKEELFTAYNNIAASLNNPREILDYLYHAHRIAQLLQNEEMLFVCRLNLIHNYLDVGEFSRAHNLLQLIEEQSNRFFNDQLISFYYVKGCFHFYSGELEKAKEYFQRVIEEDKGVIPAKLIKSHGLLLLARVKEENDWPGDELDAILNKLLEKNFSEDYYEILGEFAQEVFLQNRMDLINEVLARVRVVANKEISLKSRIIFRLLQAYEKGKTEGVEEINRVIMDAEREGLKPLVWQCKLAQARLQEEFNNKEQAVLAYLQTLDSIYELIVKVPEELRSKFLLTHQCYKVREALNQLINIDEDVSSLDINSFFDYEPYKTYLREEREQTNKSIGFLIQKLSENWRNWEEKILQFGLHITAASRGIVFKLDTSGKLHHGLYLDAEGNSGMLSEMEVPLNKFINQDINELCITDMRRYYLQGHEEKLDEFGDCRALAFVPIKKRKRLYGYLYFDCNHLLHNIKDDVLQELKALAGLLVLYYEHQQLEESSSKDKITGALTRRFVEQTLRESLEIAGQQEEPLSLIIFDIDDFKAVNDKFGHRKGDQILGCLAKTAEQVIGERDILGRYGGEEFIVIMPKTKKDRAYQIAESLRRTIAAAELLDGFHLTISLGVASYPEDALLMEELIEKADQALYVAKEGGKNRACIWKEGIASELQREDKLAGIITGNLVQDQRRGLVIVELLQLLQEKKDMDKKIYHFLGRLLESVEADNAILYLDNNRTYVRERFKVDWASEIKFDPSLAKECWESGKGRFMLDWEINEHGTGDLYSIIITPVISNGRQKGVLLLAARADKKEFDFKQFNFVQTLSSLLGSILS